MWHFGDDIATPNPLAPIDELSNYLQTMGSPASAINPQNPMGAKPTPSANLANPEMNADLPNAFTNPANPAMNPYLPGAATNPANPDYNPSNPGAQNNPANPAFNQQLPNAVNNPASPKMNPNYPGSITSPSAPMHNPDYPAPGEIGKPPTNLPPNASFPPQTWQFGASRISKISAQLPPGIPIYEHLCGQGFLNNGWSGWTPVNLVPGGEVAYGGRTWTCPTCNADLKTAEHFPREVGRAPERTKVGGALGPYQMEAVAQEEQRLRDDMPPNRFEPWEYGSYGKGFVTPFGRPIHWKTDGIDGYPWHAHGMAAYHWTVPAKHMEKELYPFVINPRGNVMFHDSETPPLIRQRVFDSPPGRLKPDYDGEVNNEYYGYGSGESSGSWLTGDGPTHAPSWYSSVDKSGWRFGTTLVEHSKGAGGFEKRRPLIYDKEGDVLHVGPPGAIHADVLAQAWPDWYLREDDHPQGWIGRNPEAGSYDAVYNRGQSDETGWYGRFPRPSAQAHGLAMQIGKEYGQRVNAWDAYRDGGERPRIKPNDPLGYQQLDLLSNWHFGDWHHLAPTQERDRIQQHGLIPANPYWREERARHKPVTAGWRFGDNSMGDSRNFPDPYEPRPSMPPAPKGCTCQQGHKLDCPIHGLDASGEAQDLDHIWSLPENNPIGYPQDDSDGRAWTTPYQSSWRFV